MPVVNFGPGTMTVTVGDAAAAEDFSCEVMAAAITHGYESVGEQKTPMCGTVRPASQVRSDGMTASVENDLTAAGLYKFLLDHDLAVATVDYTPNTQAGAKWQLQVQLTLPQSIGSDAFGSPIVSEVEWAGVGAVTFTPATAAVAP
jgi:hypothetical protein